jgi:hypothetical protein
MLLNINEITAIEDRYVVNGAPSLGDAYSALLTRWKSRDADREDCLRLLFLSWYSCSEPNTLTGLPEGSKVTLVGVLFEYLGGEQTTDPEVMFAVGVMASLFPYCCGDEEIWSGIARSLKRRYRDVQHAERLPLNQFDGRGAYGKYFGHILAKEDEQLNRSRHK